MNDADQISTRKLHLLTKHQIWDNHVDYIETVIIYRNVKELSIHQLTTLMRWRTIYIHDFDNQYQSVVS